MDVPADLSVTSVVADAASKSGEPINVRWTVENVGDFATDEVTNSIWQYVFLSKDQVFDASRAFLADSISYVLDDPLQPGETYTDSTTVSTPPGSSGIWYAHVFTNIGIRRGQPVLTEWGESALSDLG